MPRRNDGWKRVVDNKLNAYGETDFDKKIIKINKKKAKKSAKRGVKGELIDSIVHEEMHVKHPKMTEKQIILLTNKKLKQMGPKQKNKFYSRYR